MTETETATQRQEALLACERLVQDFAWHVDHHDARQAALLFAPDGTFHRRGETLQGRPAILAAFLKRSQAITTRHLCSNLRLQIESPTRIRGTCYFQLFRHVAAASDAGEPSANDGAGGEPRPLALPEFVGEYHDLFVKSAEGWRIADRVARAVFQL